MFWLEMDILTIRGVFNWNFRRKLGFCPRGGADPIPRNKLLGRSKCRVEVLSLFLSSQVVFSPSAKLFRYKVEVWACSPSRRNFLLIVNFSPQIRKQNFELEALQIATFLGKVSLKTLILEFQFQILCDEIKKSHYTVQREYNIVQRNTRLSEIKCII